MRGLKFFPLILVMTLLGFVSSTAAQEDHSADASKVERKNRAPVSKDILKVTLPRATETTLSNGVVVLIMENHRLPMISIQYNISGAGALFEPANTPGLASITAQMLREGTKTRTSVQIAEQSAQLGAEISALAGFGSSATVINASGLSDNFDQWLALTNDLLLNANFPADELNRLKQRLKAQLRQQRANPNFLANERFNNAVYGSYPAAVVAATNESIDAMTAEMLAKWHQERYTPQNTVLGITGDVKAAEIVPKLEKALAGWKRTDLKEVLPPNPKPVQSKRVSLVDRPGSVQTTVALGNIAIDRRDPDYIALTV